MLDFAIIMRIQPCSFEDLAALPGDHVYVESTLISKIFAPGNLSLEMEAANRFSQKFPEIFSRHDVESMP